MASCDKGQLAPDSFRVRKRVKAFSYPPGPGYLYSESSAVMRETHPTWPSWIPGLLHHFTC